MLTNVNKLDNVISIITGGLISLLYVTGSMTGMIADLLMVIGGVLLLSGISKYFGVHRVFQMAVNENKPLY